MTNRHDPGAEPVAPVSPLVQWFHQGLGFSLVGALQLVFDWGVMMGLSAAGLPLPAANVAGRVAGASLGFWGNRRITFRGHHHPPWPQLARFVVLWSVLTLISTLSVTWVEHHDGLTRAWLYKPLIEGVLAVISFFSSRWWVYR